VILPFRAAGVVAVGQQLEQSVLDWISNYQRVGREGGGEETGWWIEVSSSYRLVKLRYDSRSSEDQKGAPILVKNL